MYEMCNLQRMDCIDIWLKLLEYRQFSRFCWSSSVRV